MQHLANISRTIRAWEKLGNLTSGYNLVTFTVEDCVTSFKFKEENHNKTIYIDYGKWGMDKYVTSAKWLDSEGNPLEIGPGTYTFKIYYNKNENCPIVQRV